MRPSLSYLICATPRSGSTLLCEALRGTGVAGRPEEYFQHRRTTRLPRRPREYFEDVDLPEVDEILGAYTRVDDEVFEHDPRRFDRYADFIDWTIERGTTPNGVFGGKVMWGYFGGFVAGLREIEHEPDLPVREVLDRIFPDLRFVFVTRDDKVRQAVSLWKALQTWTWRRDETDGYAPHAPLRFSFEAIHHLSAQLEREDEAWRGFFRECRIDPYHVVYERFADAYEEVTLELVDYLGIPRDGVRLGPRAMARQADALSEEWVSLYRARAAA